MWNLYQSVYIAYTIITCLSIATQMYVNMLMLEASKEELISPCACTENLKFVHVHCLEKSVYNVTSKPICMYCKGLLPLELKYKPLIEVSYMKWLTIAKYLSKIKSSLERKKKEFLHTKQIITLHLKESGYILCSKKKI